MAQIRPALAQEMTEVPPEYLVALTVHLQHILRNKRCLLAYMQYRLDKVRDLRWETGGAIIPTRLQRKLSAKESEFFASYDKILSDYMGNYPLLDLTGSTLPPKEICIEVRVLADCGEIMTDQGPVNLERGRNHEDILPRPFLRLFGAAWRSEFTTYTLFWPTQEGLRCFIRAGGRNQAKVETRGSWRTALAEELHTLVPSRRQSRGWLVGLKHTASNIS
ncbi:hypothetical protein NSK_000489 [Nannochloropsis salina CCMP1776]|uniref:GINS subunit domain-containing protein n=1 Tax=Nannochloropsis salina CCMP1776 TaxID=1027361 RepID=A0A4D9DET3_9STRA|nr:hypothetical protein NSK_000489 [Nannochloropsis salina CCMP1776]|eukprot:TFJ88135.1 hypothetical protein NSK_000489 [Nannochloropsis salina CCMP1776]